jgi:hypothetical protein
VVGAAGVVCHSASTLQANIVANTPSPSALSPISTGGCNVFWNNVGGNAVNYTLAATDRVVDPEFCDATSERRFPRRRRA